MNRVVKKIHYIFWLSIPVIILIGILNIGKTFDVNIDDTYYIIDFRFITHLISIVFLIIGFGYWIMQKSNRRLSRRLLKIHVIITFGGLLIIWILSLFYKDPFQDITFNNYLSFIIYLIILIIILSQFLFLYNIFRGLIKNA